MPRIAIAAAVLAGCAYQPSSFTDGGSFAGARATVGCLDIAVERRPDHEAKPVLAYRFGNRCNRGVDVDLGAVTVVGRFASGELTLRPYDPRGELRPLRLDGRTAGAEAIAYGMPGAGAAATQICVDVASILREQPARWICFAQRADVAAAEEKSP